MAVRRLARDRNGNGSGDTPKSGHASGHRHGKRAAFAGALVCAAAMTVSPASQATASAQATAAACQTRADARHTDWTGMHFLGDVVCSHNTGSVRVQSTTDSMVNGQIDFSPSWFVCWKRGSPYQGGDIWYYTQGDTVSGSRTAKGWGYLPAAELSAATHPVPGLKQCTWS
ncbi:hypothetical protein [Streptomyces sp. NPDC018059]|uniref:hypothetical protein n=1 Tax=Streptomyces sp. NPDC018059 TaxID=3365041 RepID=UPI0037A359C6